MTVPSTFKLGYPSLKYEMTPCMQMERNPTTSDLNHPTVGGFYPIPTIWVNKNTNNAYILTGITSGTTANWTPITLAAEGAVAGPASATDNALARFDGTTGKLVQNGLGVLSDTGVLTGITQMGIGIAPTARMTLAAGTATANTAPLKLTLGVNLTAPEAGAIEYDGTLLTYTNNAGTRLGLVAGPTVAVDNAIARFDATTGKLIQSSAVTIEDTTGVMTFPAAGGIVLTTGGAAARKGTGTFTAGASGAIATTAVAADSVIVITRTNLAGAAAALGEYFTITPGASFIVTSGDAADTSSFTWAIVG